jgi:hypothetical protein
MRYQATQFGRSHRQFLANILCASVRLWDFSAAAVHRRSVKLLQLQ